MRRWIRRIFTLSLLGGGAAGALKLKGSRSKKHAPAAANDWPPMRPTTPPRAAETVSSNNGAGTSGSATMAPPSGSPAATPVVDASLVQGFADATATAGVGANWVAPVDGACPASHPVKANDDSHIFHVPGGRFYERTVAERCYTTADAAAADGYRPAKV
jgi:hypothetical protein